MATFFDPSTVAGWFDDGQVLRAFLGDRSRHAVIASGFGASNAPILSEGNLNVQVSLGRRAAGRHRRRQRARGLYPAGQRLRPRWPRHLDYSRGQLRRHRQQQAAEDRLQRHHSGGGLDGHRRLDHLRHWHDRAERRRLAAMASVFKYGAAGSNTQIGIHNQAIVSTAVAPVSPSLITAVEWTRS